MPKTRKAKRSSAKTRKMIPECKRVYEQYKSNKKFKIVTTLSGGKAIEAAKQFLFSSSSDADAWASQWSSAEKQKAFLFAYVRKLKSKSALGVKLCLPKGKDFSVVGEEHPYEKGHEKLKSILKDSK